MLRNSVESSRQTARQTVFALCLIAGAAVYSLMSIAHNPDGQTITNEAISTYLFKTGQRVVARSNMTETMVQSASIAVVLELEVSSDALIGNGADSSTVRATVYDAAGNLVPDGQPVAFSTSHGTFSNGGDTTYTLTANGVATAVLRSSLLSGGIAQTAEVIASTMGASGLPLTKEVAIVFYSAAVQGRISSSAGKPVQEIVVTAYDANRQPVGYDTLESKGTFLIPIQQSGLYTLSFQYTGLFGDEIRVLFSRNVEVPSHGGVPAVSPLGAIIGNLVNASTGQPVRERNIPVLLYHTPSNPQDGGAGSTFQPTDDNGVFKFDSLTAGRSELRVIDVQYGGALTVQRNEPGTFILDANINLTDVPTFDISKASNKRIVEIGDAITYTVEIANASDSAPLLDVRLVDELPHAFVFAKGSAKSNDIALPEPENSRKLDWRLADSLLPRSSITITYSVYVGAGALESDGINKAYATATTITGQKVRTTDASVQVTIRPGVFTDRGIVVGKVFYDVNENAEQDDGEEGISGVELWMEDGTRVTTGDGGKYSLPEVLPGQHVLRVNDVTLPYGSELLALRSESAGDGLSRFFRLTEGGIARTDFYVRATKLAQLAVAFENDSFSVTGDSTRTRYRIEYFDIGDPTRIQLADTLPDGYVYDLKSIMWKGKQLYPESQYARTLLVDFPKRTANSADTLDMLVVADTAASRTLLRSAGQLRLSYVHAKDVVYSARAEPFPVIVPPIAIAEPLPKDTLQAEPMRETVQTTRESVSVALADSTPEKQPRERRAKLKHRKRESVASVPESLQQKAHKDTVSVVDEKSKVIEGPVVPPLPEAPAKFDRVTNGLIAAGALLALVFIALLLRHGRRKSGGDGR